MNGHQARLTQNLTRQATSRDDFSSLDFSGTEGMSERVVEIPWAASWLGTAPQRILDVGIAMSSPEHMDLLMSQSRHGALITGVDIIDPRLVLHRLNPDEADFMSELDVVVGDISHEQSPLSHRNAEFDAVLCISTLEHVGFDRPRTSNVAGVFERAQNFDAASPIRDPAVDARVLGNLRKALRMDGMLLISVPYGAGNPVLLQDSLGLFTYEHEYSALELMRMAQAQGFLCEELLVFSDFGENGWVRIHNWESWQPERRACARSAAACALLALRRVS